MKVCNADAQTTANYSIVDIMSSVSEIAAIAKLRLESSSSASFSAT
jgi:hypothetical protein